MKYRGNGELVFFLHCAEISRQKQAQRKSRKININEVNNLYVAEYQSTSSESTPHLIFVFFHTSTFRGLKFTVR